MSAAMYHCTGNVKINSQDVLVTSTVQGLYGLRQDTYVFLRTRSIKKVLLSDKYPCTLCELQRGTPFIFTRIVLFSNSYFRSSDRVVTTMVLLLSTSKLCQCMNHLS